MKIWDKSVKKRHILRKKIGRTRAASAAMSPPTVTRLRPERAALALWVRPVHASLMAGSTADNHLTVDGDAMFVVGADA